ncbi:MAG: N-acetyl-glucosamine-6-phosphate deacetylase, partial [Watsoniomyces obsoletus]
MNRLHLHATESQSWPLEIPALPDLAAKGAYQPDLVWSTDDLEGVQAYGDDRGVMVYLEIDMPGHFYAALQALPELKDPAETGEYQSVQGFPNNSLNPAHEP